MSPAKLKPTKADRKPLVKSLQVKASPAKPKVGNRRKILEAQIEAMVKQIVFWRDQSQCVLQQIDGGRCAGRVVWGHFVPRARSKYLKYDLATFCQCDGHNLIHDSRKTGGGDPIFGLWVTDTFGVETLRAISLEQRAHLGANGKRSIPELEDMLARYDHLYDMRFYVELTIPALVEKGYYGEVIQKAMSQKG